MAKTTSTQRDHELWEAVGKGAVWVTVTDVRGNETQRQLGGPGSNSTRRLRIKVEDRIATQDAFPDGNPFDNGRLRRVDEDAPEEQAAKTNDQLIAQLSSASLEDDLMAASEFEVRRLKDLAEAGSATAVSVAQLHIINSVIEQRWPKIAAPSDQLAAANER